MTAFDELLAIDAGGTFFKYAVLNKSTGKYITEIGKEPVNSNGTPQEILGVYRKIIEKFPNVCEVGISTPGPFDYVNCKSFMTHKFKSIYGVDLKAAISHYCRGNIDVYFMSDTNAFLLGEYHLFKGKYKNIIGITVGTGLGMAVIVNGTLFINDLGGPREVIFSLPYEGGILEDIVSGEGIVRAYNGSADITAKDVAGFARNNDRDAIGVFEKMGTALGNALKPFAEKYETEVIVIGGQVAKSLDLFENSIRVQLGGAPVLAASEPEGAALKGLIRRC